MRLMPVIAAFFVASSAYGAPCTSIATLDMSKFASELGNREVTFVARDLKTGKCWETTKEDAGARHAPWSTFKIPHFLIALDTGAVASADETIRWNPIKHPALDYWPAAWAKDQTLQSAFENSAAWYFQELVPRIGRPRYKKWLGSFHYGNQDVPVKRDDFWLRGSLKISPREQVEFLTCLAVTGCGASTGAVKALETAALQAEIAGTRMYAKTGSGPKLPGQFDGAFEGWYVGYVRAADSMPLAAFAIFVRGPNYASIRTFRQDMTYRLLEYIGLWHR